MTIPFNKGQSIRFHVRNKVTGTTMEFDGIAEEGGWTGMALRYRVRFEVNGKEVVAPVAGKNIFIVRRTTTFDPPTPEEWNAPSPVSRS